MTFWYRTKKDYIGAILSYRQNVLFGGGGFNYVAILACQVSLKWLKCRLKILNFQLWAKMTKKPTPSLIQMSHQWGNSDILPDSQIV